MSRTETTHAATGASADERTVGRFREAGIALPKFEQLGDLREELPLWDEAIRAFNAHTGMEAA